MAKHPLEILNMFGDAAHKKAQPNPDHDTIDNNNDQDTSKASPNKQFTKRQAAAINEKGKQRGKTGTFDYGKPKGKTPGATD